MSEFAGFPPPIKNFFSLPNEITDIIAGITNLSELKILLYVIRHTWGYHEFGISKAITNDEFMYGRKHSDGSRMDKGTGLSEQGVRDGTNKAIKDGYLICDTDDSDKGRIKKSYRLRMQGEVQNLDPQSLEVKTLDPYEPRPLNSVPQANESLTSGLGNVDPRPNKRRPRTEKETKEKHSRNTPEERKSDITPTSPPAATSSLTHSSSDVSFSSLADTQEGVTVPSASVKGAQSDTLNLANAHPFSPDPVGNTQPSHAPQSVARGSIEPPDHDAARSYSHSSQHDAPEVQNALSGAQGYKTSQQLNASDQSVPPNATPMEEVKITQEMMIEWVKEVGVKVSKKNEENNKQIYTTLVREQVKSLEDATALKGAARNWYAEDDIWFGNLVEDRVLKRWKAGKKKAVQQSPPKVAMPGMETAILSAHSELCINPHVDPDFGACMQLWYGSGQKDYWIMRDLEEWEWVRADTEGMLKEALAYGKSYNLQLVK